MILNPAPSATTPEFSLEEVLQWWTHGKTPETPDGSHLTCFQVDAINMQCTLCGETFWSTVEHFERHLRNACPGLSSEMIEYWFNGDGIV